MWILILTMFGGTPQSGKAVTAVEFNNYEACHVAAEAWLKDAPKAEDAFNRPIPGYSGTIRALCVKKG